MDSNRSIWFHLYTLILNEHSRLYCGDGSEMEMGWKEEGNSAWADAGWWGSARGGFESCVSEKVREGGRRDERRPVKVQYKGEGTDEWKDGWMKSGAVNRAGSYLPVLGVCVCAESGQTERGDWELGCTYSWLDYSTHWRLIDMEGGTTVGAESSRRSFFENVYIYTVVALHTDNPSWVHLSLTHQLSASHISQPMWPFKVIQFIQFFQFIQFTHSHTQSLTHSFTQIIAHL